MSNPSQPGATGRVFASPTALRDRVGSRFGKIDPDAIAKAEAALKGLSAQFGQWLQDEVGKLEAAGRPLPQITVRFRTPGTQTSLPQFAGIGFW